eukprot:scaffold4105_cov105-Isochrysis_galbana.AAC.1
MRWLCSASEKRSSASSSSVARGDSLAWCELRDGGGSPLPMARSCFVRASCASASARSANLLRVHLQTRLGSKGKVPTGKFALLLGRWK